MALNTLLVAIMIGMSLIVWILFVIFGQITVRKLRKNPITRDHLGIEFASGWDIFNVASALSRPQWLNEKYKKSKFFSVSANPEILYQNTSRFDRTLARVFWGLYISTGLFMFLVLLLNWLGVIE